MYALFEQYPRLRETVPHVALAELPTPVQRLEHLERELGDALGSGRLYAKRDDLSAHAYGGNKVRNLEFLLGRAVRDQRKTVLTFGTAGSNQAAATAIYANGFDIRTIAMLLPQPNAHYVRLNLLLCRRADAELHYNRVMPGTVLSTLYQLGRHRLREGRFPQIIPPGGTSPLGMAGFVNAALELGRQIDAGDMPEPDYLYAALGTMGTVLGLLLGLKVAGLRTRIVAVRVTEPQFSSMRKAHRLFRRANALLHEADPAFPLVPFPEGDFTIRHDYFGTQYALYTEESVQTVQRVREAEGLELEGTYTGKAFAALLADAEAGKLLGKTALFWITNSSRDLSPEVEGLDYHELPKAFHRYFEQDVQPLDRR